MGINCAAFLADLFINFYEEEFMQKLIKDKRKTEYTAFNRTFR